MLIGFIVVAVILVVAVVYAIIKATQSTPVIKFEKSGVSPQFRCPGAPVTVEWASQGKPVTITLNGKTMPKAANESGFQIAASEFDSGPDDTKLSLTINAAGGETVDYWVHTVRGVKRYDQVATKTAQPFVYDYEFLKKIWADNILFIGVKLIEPTTYLNEVGKTIPCEWQYSCGMSRSGVLSQVLNNFEEMFPQPVRVDDARQWGFRLGNIPVTDSQLRHLAATLANPKFQVIVRCPDK